MKITSMAIALLWASAHGIEASAAPFQVFVPLGAMGQIQIIDAATGRAIGTIDGAGNAHGLAVTPDGRHLVAGSYSEDAPGADGNPPRPSAVSQSEHEKHHTKSTVSEAAPAGTSYVSVIDIATREVVRRIAVQGAVHHVAISPDGKVAVTTHPGTGKVSAIDLERFETVATVATGAAPNYAVFSSDGSKVYVSNAGDNTVSEIDVGAWAVTRQIASGRSPEHVVLSADDQTLYTNNVADGNASVISLAEGRVIHTFPIGTAPHGIDLSDDGATLFATSQGEDKLVAIDLSSGEIRQASLSPAPYHLTVVRGSSELYVSSRAEKRLWVLDQKTLTLHQQVAIDGIGHQIAVTTR